MFLVVANMNEAVGVQVQTEDIKYGTVGYVVVILFSTGYSLGVTETATTDDSRFVYFHAFKGF